MTSDEAAMFSLNSQVNTRNITRYAPYGNGILPDHYVEHLQDAGQVMVWVELTGNSDVLGPHFTNENFDTKEYLRIIRYNVTQREFRNLGIIQNNVWWQQDTSNQSINYRRGGFPSKLISKREDIPPPPPRSPDLAILDFFLRGYLKQKNWNVPRNSQPSDVNQLRRTIIRRCGALQRQMIMNVFNAMTERYNTCINANGHQLQNE